MIILLIGPPASGKGTQGAFLSSKYDLPLLSTGEMLRSEVAEKTTLGKNVQTIIESGGLVDDVIVRELTRKRISHDECKAGFILDGAVRTYAQALDLDRLLHERERQLDMVLNFVIGSEELVGRMHNRVEKGGKRKDDTPEVLKERIENFQSKTKPVLNHYEEAGLLKNVDATGTIEEISRNITELVTVLKKEKAIAAEDK